MSSYGTINSNTTRNSTDSGDESHPLLTNGKATARSSIKRLRTHLTQDVSEAWADLLLLLGYIITGLLDSSAVFIWGAFVSMQTGNTVYLGLGLADPSGGTNWIRSGVSICSFCFGSLCFGFFHRYFGPKRRGTLIASYTIQTLFIAAAALIVMLGETHGGDLHWHVLVPLAFVAFQASGQAVTSRALHYNSMTSVVLTSIYCDLWSDPKLLAPPKSNLERNRRVAAPVLLLVGAVCGGFWARSPLGLAGAMWTAVVLKSCIIVAWAFWKGEKEAEG